MAVILEPVDPPVTWDCALRALVELAFDAKERGDEREFADACREIVHAHRVWPLVRVRELLAHADRELEERTRIVEAEPWRIWEFFAFEPVAVVVREAV